MASVEGREGFTLFETLIAFLILAGALAISAQTVAIAARSVSISRERTEVLALAKILRLETVPGILRDGRDTEGTKLAFRWKISLRPLAASDTTKRGGFVVVTISAPSGREHMFIYFGSDRQDVR